MSSLSLHQNQKEKEAYVHVYLEVGSRREEGMVSELHSVISYGSACIRATC